MAPSSLTPSAGCKFVHERQGVPFEEISDPPHIAPMENRPRLAPIDTRVGASFAQSPTGHNSPSSSSSSWPFVSSTVFSTPSGILQSAAGLPVYPSAYREGGQQGAPLQLISRLLPLTPFRHTQMVTPCAQPAPSVVARSVARGVDATGQGTTTAAWYSSAPQSTVAFSTSDTVAFNQGTVRDASRVHGTIPFYTYDGSMSSQGLALRSGFAALPTYSPLTRFTVEGSGMQFCNYCWRYHNTQINYAKVPKHAPKPICHACANWERRGLKRHGWTEAELEEKLIKRRSAPKITRRPRILAKK
ncbi:hypothetical protein MKEN_00223900 [Mycena kentingensis (nom. inval.)]|nr:hypothetical protein MKEN_00223900 [Mycena kentingensis (nom. inval.)]